MSWLAHTPQRCRRRQQWRYQVLRVLTSVAFTALWVAGCESTERANGGEDASESVADTPAGTSSTAPDSVAPAADTLGLSGLRFSVFHLDLDPRRLLEYFPMSRHRMTMSTSGRGWSHIPGFTENPPDPDVLWAAFTSGAGTYILRVLPDEVADGIYYVQFEFEPGRIMRMWLRFEVPVALRGTIMGRSCTSVMDSLMAAYGPPTRELQPYAEEAAWHEPKLWLDDRFELRWDCAEGAVILRRLAEGADAV